MRVSRERQRAKEKEEEARNPGARPWGSPMMRGGDAPLQVKVKISGWKELYLFVTDNGNYHNDCANLAEARLVARDGAETFLDMVDPVSAKQEWGTLRRDNKSVVGGPMAIA